MSAARQPTRSRRYRAAFEPCARRCGGRPSGARAGASHASPSSASRRRATRPGSTRACADSKSRRFAPRAATAARHRRAAAPRWSPHRIVLVERAVCDRRRPLPAGMRVRTLAEALDDGEPQGALLRVPARAAAPSASRPSTRHSAADALLVDVDDGRRAPKPLHRRAACAGAKPGMSHPRVVVRDGDAAALPASSSTTWATTRPSTSSMPCVEVELAPTRRCTCTACRRRRRAFHIERIEATRRRRRAHVRAARRRSWARSLARLDLHVTPGGAAARRRS